MALGGAISGEHGIGDREEEVLPRARGPGQARAHAPHQGGVRPHRDPQPRHHLRLTRPRSDPDERRTGPDPHPRRRRRRRVLHEPRHLGDALRRRPRRRARDARRCSALFEGVATGAADGYARMADRPAAVLLHLGPGARQRPGQPAQRPPGPHAGGQHRRRPRHLPQAKYDAPLAVRHRDASPATCRPGSAPRRDPESVAADAADAVAAAFGPPGPGGHAHPARRRVLARTAPGPVGPQRPRRGRHRRPTTGSRTSPPSSGPASPPPSWWAGRAALEGRPRSTPAASPPPPGPSSWPRPSRPALERGAGRAAGRSGSPTWPSSPQTQLDGLRHLVLVDAKSPVSFFAYPDKASDLVPEGCTVHVLAAPDDDAAAAPWPRWPTPSAPPADGATVQPARSGPTVPTGRAQRRDRGRRRRRPPARGRHRVRRGQHRRACSSSGFTAGAPRARLARA